MHVVSLLATYVGGALLGRAEAFTSRGQFRPATRVPSARIPKLSAKQQQQGHDGEVVMNPEDVARFPLPGTASPISLSFSPDDNILSYLHAEGGQLTRQVRLRVCDATTILAITWHVWLGLVFFRLLTRALRTREFSLAAKSNRCYVHRPRNWKEALSPAVAPPYSCITRAVLAIFRGQLRRSVWIEVRWWKTGKNPHLAHMNHRGVASTY